MKKIFIKRIALLSALALVILCSLVYRDQRSSPDNTAEFTRKYNHKSLKPFSKITLSFIPGEILDVISRDTVILNSPDGRKLYWLDLKNNTTIEYTPPNIRSKYDRITMAAFQKNTLTVMNGNGHTILKKKSFPKHDGTNEIDTLNFTILKGLPVSDHHFVMKKMLHDNTSCRIISYNTTTGIQKEITADKKDLEDCLVTDGSLFYDENNGVYFINLYNSTITRFDTSLHRIYESSTIDKTRTMPLVQYNAARKSNNFISPHRIINYCSTADTNTLYVLSAAMAGNDLHSTFARNTPLDLYHASTGNYKESFHLEDISINAVRGIRINGDILFVVADRFLYLYNFKNMPYAQQ
jgi:outer membrane protein assembly factor BamB